MNFLVFLSTYILPFFIFYVVAYGLLKGRNVYQAFVEGAKGGFHTALGILPTLVGLLAAVGVLRASGFLDLVSGLLKNLLKGTGFPAEILPLVIVRLFSNSAAHRPCPGSLQSSRPGLPPGSSGLPFLKQYGDRLLHHEHLFYERQNKKDPLYPARCTPGNPGGDCGECGAGVVYAVTTQRLFFSEQTDIMGKKGETIMDIKNGTGLAGEPRDYYLYPKAEPPYERSDYIEEVLLDRFRYHSGEGDMWPMTWAKDGCTYCGAGDNKGCPTNIWRLKTMRYAAGSPDQHRKLEHGYDQWQSRRT